MSTDSATRKRALRRELLAARWAMTESNRNRAHHGLRQHIRDIVAQLRPAIIAAYVPVGTEPLAHHSGEQASGPGLLILPELLRGAAVQAGQVEPRILLPIWRDDNELDWADYHSVDALAASQRGLWEPSGPRLGLDQIGRADLVLVPSLAADRLGRRLGRGAGCYDRSLTRSHATTVAVIYDHELLDEIPHHAHDVPMSTVITPSSLHRMQ